MIEKKEVKILFTHMFKRVKGGKKDYIYIYCISEASEASKERGE